MNRIQATVFPGRISGMVIPPPSKSVVQRLYAGALLHAGTTFVRGVGTSADEQAALGIVRQLGGHVSRPAEGMVRIESGGQPSGTYIDCGESGLCARLFTPIAALSAAPVRIEGLGSLLRRDMRIFGDVLPLLGVRLAGFTGRLPFTVEGPMRPANLTIDGSAGSQYLTGLLFALAFSAHQKIIVTVRNLKSRPYADMTIEVLGRFGKVVAHEQHETFTIDPASFSEVGPELVLDAERDWSAAAAWFVAGAIGGSVRIKGLPADTVQADRAILEALRSAGAEPIYEHGIYVVNSGPLRAFRFDGTDCPDLFPPLAVLAACSPGTSELKGTSRLGNKESDRTQAISTLLDTLGVPHRLEPDTLYVEGVDTFRGGTVSAHNDHRMVMAAAIAATRAQTPVVIEGAEAVTKSYPDFFRDLQSLQISCTLAQSL